TRGRPGARPIFMVVGGVDPDAVARTVAEEMEEVRGRPEEATPRRPGWPGSPRVEGVDREKAQTALLLGFPGPDRNDPDIYSLDGLSNAIGRPGGPPF